MKQNILIIAFDQSLANTGVCVLHNCPTSGLVVKEAESLRNKSSITGFEDTFIAAHRLSMTVEAKIARIKGINLRRPTRAIVVIEQPPVARVMRQDSSLLSATMIVDQAARAYIPSAMVSVPSIRSHYAAASKAHVHEGLAHEFPEAYKYTSNEAERDALAIAMCFAYRWGPIKMVDWGPLTYPEGSTADEFFT